MAEAIPPAFWGPEAEEVGVLLTWAGWAVEAEAEPVVVAVGVGVAAAPVLELVVLVHGGPEELLEELLGVLDEAGGAGLRWDSSEPSSDCPDRYGAGAREGGNTRLDV